MSRLQLNLLGQFEIYLDGDAIMWFPTDRVRALLLILATEPLLSQQRSTIASLLWSEVDDSAARRNLRRCLSRLKGALGDEAGSVLEASRNSIGLLSAESDYLKFQLLASSNDAADWQTAIDLISGELAKGFHLKNSVLFDDWLAELRLTLAHQQRELLHKLLDTITVDPQARLRYALRLAALDPFDDATQRIVMSLHAEMGNAAAAMAHYDEYVEILHQELSAEPEQATRELYTQLVAASASHPVELVNFPAQLTPFIGRAAKVAAIVDRLRQPDCRLVTLLGAGGAGKTRLSIEVAGHLTSTLCADGVYFVPLVTANSAHDVLVSLHRALSLPTQGKDIEAQISDFLRHKQLVLLLDNVEQLSGQLGFLAQLLQTAAGVKILATSRDVVGISAEYRFQVTGITDLHDASAVLWAAIQRVDPDFELNAANLAIGARICERLHGVPLALELAATWISTLDLDSIRAEIEHAYTFLESPMLDTPDRHRSLGAIFEHSWELLTPKRQTILAAASIFRGGFDMVAARKILGANINDLRRLLEQSLLTKAESTRYSLHELVRQFAAERLEPTEALAVQKAHAEHYLELVSQYEQQLVSEDARAASELISADLPNINVAWRWAVKHDAHDLLANSIVGLTKFYRLTARFAEGDQLYVETIEQLSMQDDTLLALLHVGCAHFRMWQSSHVGSEQSAENALASASRAEDGNLIAESQIALGRSLRAQGKLMQAIPIFHQGLAACDGDSAATRALRAELLANLALISSFGVAPYAGQELVTKALIEAQHSGNKMIEAFVLSIVAYANLRVERISDALNAAQSGIALAQRMGYLIFEAACLASLGRAKSMLGLYDEGETDLHQSWQIYRSIGDNLGQVQSLAGLCRSSYDKGDYAKTIEYADLALALAKANGIELHQGHMLYWIGLVQYQLGDLDAAEATFESVRQIRVSLNLERSAFGGHYMFGLGAIAAARGSAEMGRDIIASMVDRDLKSVVDPIHLVKQCLLGYPVLKAAHDPRAEKFLQLGYDHIMQTADAIENPVHRQSYPEKSRLNRELIEMYRTSELQRA